jgi:hypothetical protein
VDVKMVTVSGQCRKALIFMVGSSDPAELDEPPGHVVGILSGGLDSTTMAFALRAAGPG